MSDERSGAGKPAHGEARDGEAVRQQVRQGYGRIARGENATSGGCCGPSTSCGPGMATQTPAELAASVGYSAEELAALPEGANLGLSCGSPTAIAALRPGEVVLDLGSGAGMDAFLAGPRVGAQGRVIGVDMTADMLAKARANVAAYERRSNLSNVEFRLGEIEHLPVADASVDVVISNCVINLSPDKPQVWREIARVLKPGGRVAVSDLALERPLPPEITASVEALVGCVAGAALVADTEGMVRAAGLTGVELVRKSEYIRAMTHFDDPLYRVIQASLPAGGTLDQFITSLEVRALKPGARAKCC
jgi:SAM-dependent methyltransferase